MSWTRRMSSDYETWSGGAGAAVARTGEFSVRFGLSLLARGFGRPRFICGSMSATRPDEWSWFVEEWTRLDREHRALAAEAARLEHSRDVAALHALAKQMARHRQQLRHFARPSVTTSPQRVNTPRHVGGRVRARRVATRPTRCSADSSAYREIPRRAPLFGYGPIAHQSRSHCQDSRCQGSHCPACQRRGSRCRDSRRHCRHQNLGPLHQRSRWKRCRTGH
jgi:hypothetical protein